jgi:hypothetical protein
MTTMLGTGMVLAQGANSKNPVNGATNQNTQSSSTGAQAHKKAGKRASMHKDGSVALNPQPLPPGIVQKVNTSPAAKVGFNPQPDPPGSQAKAASKKGSASDAVSFNPQPDPPGKQANVSTGAQKATNAADRVALNPQPLPPGKAASAADKTALNPQPLPPGAKKGASSASQPH